MPESFEPSFLMAFDVPAQFNKSCRNVKSDFGLMTYLDDF